MSNLPALNAIQLDSFWKKVKKGSEDECWLWTSKGRTRSGPGGYGLFRVNRKFHGAHRVSWRIAFGKIPDGLNVLHRCDVPLCVNPKHLWLGTPLDNNRDTIQKGRFRVGKHKGETHECAKLSEKDVRLIRDQYADSKMTRRAIGQKFGVGSSTILAVLRRESWKHI